MGGGKVNGDLRQYFHTEGCGYMKKLQKEVVEGTITEFKKHLDRFMDREEIKGCGPNWIGVNKRIGRYG